MKLCKYLTQCLPLSGWLRKAITDFKAAEDDPSVVVDMACYYYRSGETRVRLCLAGSMLHAAKMPVPGTPDQEFEDLYGDEIRVLSAVNHLRCGDILSACRSVADNHELETFPYHEIFKLRQLAELHDRDLRLRQQPRGAWVPFIDMPKYLRASPTWYAAIERVHAKLVELGV